MPGVHFDLAIRHRVVMRRLRGMTFVAIAQELRPMAVLSARRIWRQYLATGSAHPFARHRRRRRDSQLTWEDMDWIARRVLAAPDFSCTCANCGKSSTNAILVEMYRPAPLPKLSLYGLCWCTSLLLPVLFSFVLSVVLPFLFFLTTDQTLDTQDLDQGF